MDESLKTNKIVIEEEKIVIKQRHPLKPETMKKTYQDLIKEAQNDPALLVRNLKCI